MGRSRSSDIDRFLGHRIRQRRLELGMSQRDLAVALGTTYQQLDKYEAGRNQLSPYLLFSIARLCGLTVSDLFAGYNDHDGGQAPPDPAFGRTYKTLNDLRQIFLGLEPKHQEALLDLVLALAGEDHGPRSQGMTVPSIKPKKSF